MKWAYILVFDDALGTRKEIQEFLDKRPEVLNWYACMSNAIFLVSERTASGLQAIMKEFSVGKNARFVIVDANTDRDGWLPKAAWEFLRNPKGVGE